MFEKLKSCGFEVVRKMQKVFIIHKKFKTVLVYKDISYSGDSVKKLLTVHSEGELLYLDRETLLPLYFYVHGVPLDVSYLVSRTDKTVFSYENTFDNLNLVINYLFEKTNGRKVIEHFLLKILLSVENKDVVKRDYFEGFLKVFSGVEELVSQNPLYHYLIDDEPIEKRVSQKHFSISPLTVKIFQDILPTFLKPEHLSLLKTSLALERKVFLSLLLLNSSIPIYSKLKALSFILSNTNLFTNKKNFFTNLSVVLKTPIPPFSNPFKKTHLSFKLQRKNTSSNSRIFI